MRNAYDLGIDYAKDYGIDITRLGCVMLSTDSPWLTPQPILREMEAFQILEDNQYDSPHTSFVSGIALDWHITVKYGLINANQEAVNNVILKTNLPEMQFQYVETSMVEVWDKIDKDGTPYECIVKKIKQWHYDDLVESYEALRDWHIQFSVLPNVDTFPMYEAHVTLGYFKPGTWDSVKGSLYKYLRDDIRITGWRFSGLQ